MKVLIATGIEDLDDKLINQLPEHGIEMAGNCYNRNILENVLKETGADTVLLSPVLTGDFDFISLVRSLREEGIRVLVLPGAASLKQTAELVKNLLPYGVYDFVFDPVLSKDIIYKLNNPGNLGDIAKHFDEASLEFQKYLQDKSNDMEQYIPSNPEQEEEDKKEEIQITPQPKQNKKQVKNKISGIDKSSIINQINSIKDPIANRIKSSSHLINPEVRKPNVIKPDLKNKFIQLKPASKGEIPNLILIWSPAKKTGKTFNAVNLAAAYSCKGYKTVLISSQAVQWFSSDSKDVMLDDILKGITPNKITGLVILEAVKENDYSKLSRLAEVVVVDNHEEILHCAGQINLVVDTENLDMIAKGLDKANIDFNKVWVVGNKIPASEVELVEIAIKLKVDYVLPFNNRELFKALDDIEYTQVFSNMADLFDSLVVV